MEREENGGTWKESDDGEGDARESARSNSEGEVEIGETNQGQEIYRKQKNDRIEVGEERRDENQEQSCDKQPFAERDAQGVKTVR
jgi:hypothetical protein